MHGADPLISVSLAAGGPAATVDPDTEIDLEVDSRRRGSGTIDHRLVLTATRGRSPLWEKEITFGVEAPFEVPDLATHDAFVIASLFPTMEVGGTLRVHGRVSQTLIRNILDFQSAWVLAVPTHCHLFDLQVDEVEELPERDPRPDANAILAFSGGMDSMTALYRNACGDAGPVGHKIAATMMIHGLDTGRSFNRDPSDLIAHLRGVSEGLDIPMAVVDTGIAGVVGQDYISHGTWLAACLTLFSGRFDVGLIGSTLQWYEPGCELYGSHPLLDPLLSSGRMLIRDDEGLYGRAEKATVLLRHASAIRALRVCSKPSRAAGNCCRCEKCVRTMLSFIAAGHEIPKEAFPLGLRLEDVGIGFGNPIALAFVSGILRAAERNGTADAPAIKRMRRRHRYKRLELAVKHWRRKRQALPRWHVVRKI